MLNKKEIQSTTEKALDKEMEYVFEIIEQHAKLGHYRCSALIRNNIFRNSFRLYLEKAGYTVLEEPTLNGTYTLNISWN